MNAIAATLRPIPFPSLTRLREDPVAQVFTLLRIGFFVLPVLMGLDKFAEVMNDNWPAYLATEFNDILPGSAQDAMYTVGVDRNPRRVHRPRRPPIRRPARRRLARRHHHQPAARRRLRRHRAARFRPAARRARAVPARRHPVGRSARPRTDRVLPRRSHATGRSRSGRLTTSSWPPVQAPCLRRNRRTEMGVGPHCIPTRLGRC